MDFFLFFYIILLLFTLFFKMFSFFSMTVEMLVFQSDLLMLYVCGCSGQSDSCSLTHTLTHEYICSHTQLYSHLKAYVEALLVGTHKVSEICVFPVWNRLYHNLIVVRALMDINSNDHVSIDWTEQKSMEMNNVNILVLPGSQHILVKSITHTFHEHSTDVNSGKVFNFILHSAAST